MMGFDISVVVPMYNTSDFLTRSLESCVAQDYEGRIEIVLVDDGSVDNTYDVARKFALANGSVDRVFSLYSQDNAGASAARNYGVFVSSSDNVFFLDSDDFLEKEAVRLSLDYLNSGDNVGLVYSDHRKVTFSGEFVADRIKNDFSLGELLTGMYVGAFRAMPKDVFFDAGGFDRGFSHAEDYDLVLKVATSGRDILHVPEVLYNYVFNGDSLSNGGEGFEKIVDGGRRAIGNAFRRLGLEEEVDFDVPWKSEDGVTRYLSRDKVDCYLGKLGK